MDSFTVTEVAEFTGYAEQQIADAVRAGQLRDVGEGMAIRFDGVSLNPIKSIRIPREDVEILMNEGPDDRRWVLDHLKFAGDEEELTKFLLRAHGVFQGAQIDAPYDGFAAGALAIIYPLAQYFGLWSEKPSLATARAVKLDMLNSRLAEAEARQDEVTEQEIAA